jgi:hypothetical protein
MQLLTSKKKREAQGWLTRFGTQNTEYEAQDSEYEEQDSRSGCARVKVRMLLSSPSGKVGDDKVMVYSRSAPCYIYWSRSDLLSHVVI